jgi:predicted ATPase
VDLNDGIRRLAKKWTGGTAWPKHLEWLELKGLRGWSAQRVEFAFPIVAIVGENGSGKSTLLQAAASVYRSDERRRTHFASEFFPDTAWDRLRDVDVTVRYGYRQGTEHKEYTIRKPTTRWLGNVERPIREVRYHDLSRIQPLATRVGYARIAKTRHTEKSATPLVAEQVKRLSEIMGRNYDGAKIALSSIDASREIPVLTKEHTDYSGFHQGSGEAIVMELLKSDLPKYSLLLIDEIESSLHPRAQRRLIRDLAETCREREIQIVLSTHSPYVLEELPLEARLYILESQQTKRIVKGVSPQFAMTQMDDEPHPECELFVEDHAAAILLGEVLALHAKEIFVRCAIIPYGAASVGHALGEMVQNNRFPRPTHVFLDGDNAPAIGCILLPGGDAPERVVFKKLKEDGWVNLWTRIARDVSVVADACNSAMTLGDHHDWVRVAANRLMCGGDTLWQAMCAEWAKKLTPDEARSLFQPIEDSLS